MHRNWSRRRTVALAAATAALVAGIVTSDRIRDVDMASPAVVGAAAADLASAAKAQDTEG